MPRGMGFARVSAVAVLGSANIDTVLTVGQMPRPGETVLADTARRNAGGKGLNQAISCARSGVDTTFLGALGDDAFGAEIRSELDAARVSATLVRRAKASTGQAFILVDDTAENMIVVSSGANAELTSITDEERATIRSAAVLLMQLELPISAVREAAQVAHEAGTSVILNAAPATTLDDELLSFLAVLIVNEHEACTITGLADIDDASQALAALVPTVIVTLGAEGSVVYSSEGHSQVVPAEQVTPVDTTGAGDTYCGAFAARISEGCDVVEAVRFATAAAALSVQSSGAVPSIPLRRDVNKFMKEQR